MVSKDKPHSDSFLKSSSNLLDDSVESLEQDIVDKLYIARRKALAQRKHNEPRASVKSLTKKIRSFIPATGIAVAVSITLVILFQSSLWQSNSIEFTNELELVSSLDNIELYENFEFYQWLAEEELQAG